MYNESFACGLGTTLNFLKLVRGTLSTYSTLSRMLVPPRSPLLPTSRRWPVSAASAFELNRRCPTCWVSPLVAYHWCHLIYPTPQPMLYKTSVGGQKNKRLRQFLFSVRREMMYVGILPKTCASTIPTSIYSRPKILVCTDSCVIIDGYIILVLCAAVPRKSGDANVPKRSGPKQQRAKWASAICHKANAASYAITTKAYVEISGDRGGTSIPEPALEVDMGPSPA